MKKIYIIDGNNFSNLEGFFEEITNKIIPNVVWGKNLNAFNDVLWGGFGDIDAQESFILVWKNWEKSKADLGYTQTILYLAQTLQTCHSSAVDKIKNRIKEALDNRGETLFDLIIQIIKDNANVLLILDEYKLNIDPIEYDPDIKKILDEIDSEVDRTLKENGVPIQRGYIRQFWSLKQKILKERYNIDWKNHMQMNPGLKVD